MNKFNLVIFACAFVLSEESAAQTISSVIELNAPSVRRNLSTVRCHELNSSLFAKSDAKSADTLAIYRILLQLKDKSTLRAFSALPEEFMWWVRSFGSVTIQALGVAAHETAHGYSEIATRCARAAQVYYFNSQQWLVEEAIGYTSNASIAASAIPEQLRSAIPTSRYQRYLVQSAEHQGNNLSLLLDELGAYLTGANLEIRLASTSLYAETKLSGVTSMNLNVGGVADLMLYTLGYLHQLKTHRPGEFSDVKASKRFREHLQRLWSSSEEVLCNARPFSVQNKGLYSVPSATLGYIYHSNFAELLREFGINSAAEDACLSFYLGMEHVSAPSPKS